MTDVDYALGYQAGEYDARIGKSPDSSHGPSSSWDAGYSAEYAAEQDRLLVPEDQ